MQNFINIDIEDVMGRLDNNEGLFIILLKKFYTQYKDYYKTIEELLEKNNYKEAHELVHSIKGVSGNLGMKQLNLSSGRLCDKIKNGKYNSDFDNINQFKMDFINVLEEIENFI